MADTKAEMHIICLNWRWTLHVECDLLLSNAPDKLLGHEVARLDALSRLRKYQRRGTGAHR
jgi:hypothetical protein